MAIVERALAATFNRPGHEVVDHRTYVFAGDGCLMEGISHEACSLAGTLGLGKLVVFWDDNGVSIDGEVEGWFTDDTPARFEAYGWHVVRDVDGHDPGAVGAAIAAARADSHGRASSAAAPPSDGARRPRPVPRRRTAPRLGRTRWPGRARRWAGSTPPSRFRPRSGRAGMRGRGAKRRKPSGADGWRRTGPRGPSSPQELERRLSGALPADWRST